MAHFQITVGKQNLDLFRQGDQAQQVGDGDPRLAHRFSHLLLGELEFLLQTLQGDLQLSGSGQWVGQRLRFSGEASAAPEREGALSNLLNIIGRRNGARSLITLG